MKHQISDLPSFQTIVIMKAMIFIFSEEVRIGMNFSANNNEHVSMN